MIAHLVGELGAGAGGCLHDPVLPEAYNVLELSRAAHQTIYRSRACGRYALMLQNVLIHSVRIKFSELSPVRCSHDDQPDNSQKLNLMHLPAEFD